MPYKSRAQARYFHANRAKLEGEGVNVDEWDEATNFSHLPEKASGMGFLASEAKREKRAGTKGKFSAAAKRAGKSTEEYAEEKQHASGKIGKRARMALMFMRARH